MDVYTYDGELLAIGSYASYLEHSFEDDRRLRLVVERGYRRLGLDAASEPQPDIEVPEALFAYIGATVALTELAVNHDGTIDEEPLVVAGPWPQRGQRTWSADRWVGLVWVDLGHRRAEALPDRCVVFEGQGDLAHEADRLADFVGDSHVVCLADSSHCWDYPGEYGNRPFDEFCAWEGARCPACGGRLRVSIGYGEAGFVDVAEVAWSGSDTCPHCGHGDHFKRHCPALACDVPCPCAYPVETWSQRRSCPVALGQVGSEGVAS